MIKKALSAAIIAVMITSVAACAQKLTDPKEIIKKSKDKVMGYKSYSYVITSEGWDFDMEKTAEATKSLTGEASGNPLAKKYAGDVDQVDGSKPKWMTFQSEYEFMKPFLVQMLIVRSDYVPDMLQGATMTYRPDKKKGKSWYIKPKVSPVGIPRGTETESGNFFYSTMHVNYMKMEFVMQDRSPVLEGIEKVNGKDAYKVTFDLLKPGLPKNPRVNYDAWGLPEQTRWVFDKNMDEFSDGHSAKVSYFFDVATLYLVKLETTQKSGELHYRKVWSDWKTNHLTPKDF